MTIYKIDVHYAGNEKERELKKESFRFELMCIEPLLLRAQCTVFWCGSTPSALPLDQRLVFPFTITKLHISTKFGGAFANASPQIRD